MSALDRATEQIVEMVPLTVRRRVKWGECDPAGVVYTVNYSEYVASAFELFMTTLLDGPLQTMKQRYGLATPARALALEFLAPLRPDDEFVMTITVADVRVRSFDLAIDARSAEGDETFRAKLAAIAVAPSTRKAVPIPDVLRRALDHYKGLCAATGTGRADV
jgi:YbgC/YbaW family acyl-CoA thioester hydrolase